MTKKITIITHSGGFHTDDVFTVAALLRLHKDAEIVRTRDPKVIDTGDYVVDVGGVYDSKSNRFDHHQEGGAGIRDDGVPYATLGLVWKEYGEKICRSNDIANIIEQKLIKPIDAFDNGVDLSEARIPGVHPYILEQIFFALEPTWQEPEKNNDECFKEAVTLAGRILERDIIHAHAEVDALVVIKDTYENTEDKRVIVMSEEYIFDRGLLSKAFETYNDVIYFVRKHEGGLWQLVAAVDDIHSFDKRKPLPESWAGKRDDELASITGVDDAIFCHNKRFMCIARSKDAAVELAKLALAS